MNEQVQEFLRQATQSIQSGQPGQALELAQQALSLDPACAEAFLLKGIALAQTGQGELATESFKSAIQLEPYNAKARYNLSVHYYGLGHKQDALDEALAALNADPSHAAAREMVQRVESEMGYSGAAMPDLVVPMTPPASVGGVTPLGHTTNESPPPTAQNAYSNNPYQGDNRSTGPVYKSPYEQQLPGGATGQHSIAFVENMGQTWTTIGWIVALLSLGTSILYVLMAGADNLAEGSNNPILFLMAILFAVVSAVWTMIDISDQRGNWGWFVAQCFCCMCCLPSVIQVAYMAKGRNV